jgi:hypothetical protein
VTTLLQPTRRDDVSDALALPGGRPGRHPRWFARHPEWPISALLVLYPLWWMLGVGTYMVIILAIPMAFRMYKWHVDRDRVIKLPPGFGFWLLFLLVSVAGVAMLKLGAPDTIQSPLSNRLISWVVRIASYGGVTILLLYAGNLTETEFPRRRLAWQLGLFALYAVIGGLGGVADPHFTFSSPMGLVLPNSLKASTLGQSIMHPGLAQLNAGPGGSGRGRPEAPFDYTNTWGYAVVLLLPWLAAAWWSYGTRWQRVIAAVAMVAVLVPIVYSEDRGAWIAVVLTVAYIALRLAARGRIALLGLLAVGLAVLALALVASPLQSIVASKVSNPSSNGIRQSQATIALKDGLSSPLLGYGDSRHMQGSASSITVGHSANCPTCGQYTIGSNGQLWLLLICSGFLGAFLYCGFFAYGIWRYRHDRTPYGLAGLLTLLLPFELMFVYDAVGAPLAIAMLAYAILWRNDMESRRWVPDGAVGDLGGRPDTAVRARPVLTTGVNPMNSSW